MVSNSGKTYLKPLEDLNLPKYCGKLKPIEDHRLRKPWDLSKSPPPIRSRNSGKQTALTVFPQLLNAELQPLDYCSITKSVFHNHGVIKPIQVNNRKPIPEEDLKYERRWRVPTSAYKSFFDPPGKDYEYPVVKSSLRKKPLVKHIDAELQRHPNLNIITAPGEQPTESLATSFVRETNLLPLVKEVKEPKLYE
eukprot:Nk52_evm45s1073 gene=Nk52_evmTU45s1073